MMSSVSYLLRIVTVLSTPSHKTVDTTMISYIPDISVCLSYLCLAYVHMNKPVLKYADENHKQLNHKISALSYSVLATTKFISFLAISP